MPAETGTEASRSDAPIDDESLFGDAADDTKAAVANEQDANEEVAENSQSSDDAEEHADTPQALKVVVSIRGAGPTIGVQQPSSDPHIESFDDQDLSGLTQGVSAVMERARAKGEDEPRYPAHARPAPSTRRQPRRSQGATQAEAAEGGADQQQPETLRLFQEAAAASRSSQASRCSREGAGCGTGAGERAGQRGTLCRDTQGRTS